MITCSNCQTVNEASATLCTNCGADLLAQPSFAERVKMNIAWVVVFCVTLIALIVMTYVPGAKDLAGLQICGAGIFLVSLVVLLVGFFKKFPVPKLVQQRAMRHLSLDTNQAKADYDKAFRLTPPLQRFKELQTYFTDWNRVDPIHAQLALINLIRITPLSERHSLGKKYPKSMQNLEKAFELEAQNAGAANDLTNAARKYIYYTYFLESKFGTMFQTKMTDNMMEAATEGWKTGIQQSKTTGSINDIRSKLISSGIATTLTVCEVCRQIVEPDHEPKHRKKLYPVYLVPDETESVKMAFQERYAQLKK